MHQPHLLSDDEYYDIATEPTSNEMFDNGAWLAPVLSSRDPGVDRRANHAVHFFAEDAKLSVCGSRFGPDHWAETFQSNDESRKRCNKCVQVCAAVTAGKHAAKTQTVTPTQDVYTVDGFTTLIQGTRRITMRINRLVYLDKDLYLLVDEGVVPARSLRRNLKKDLARADEVILIWAGESAADRIRTAGAKREVEIAARQKDTEQWNRKLAEMLAPIFLSRTTNETVDVAVIQNSTIPPTTIVQRMAIVSPDNPKE